jgi:hypothetical protein
MIFSGGFYRHDEDFKKVVKKSHQIGLEPGISVIFAILVTIIFCYTFLISKNRAGLSKF